MMLTEKEIQDCAELVAKCEQAIGERPLRDHKVDLIADNRCNDEHEWSLEKCQEMIKSLWSGHGVGAFHMARARDLFPMKEAKR